LASITDHWNEATPLDAKSADALDAWLASIAALIPEDRPEERALLDDIKKVISRVGQRQKLTDVLSSQIPIFVLFNNYFRVKPLVHLGHLADRTEKQLLDDAQYDYGNNCLLKLLGFTARQLSDLGKAAEPDPADESALQKIPRSAGQPGLSAQCGERRSDQGDQRDLGAKRKQGRSR
jgi:hypothetical protein